MEAMHVRSRDARATLAGGGLNVVALIWFVSSVCAHVLSYISTINTGDASSRSDAHRTKNQIKAQINTDN